MTFAELLLSVAIHRVGRNLKDAATQEEQLEFAAAVQRQYTYLTNDVLFPFSMDKVRQAAIALRKGTNSQIKCDVAVAHGFECFWRFRGKGSCSDEVECGHLVARAHGGPLSVENCIIECRKHNNERRTQSIEEYLRGNQED